MLGSIFGFAVAVPPAEAGVQKKPKRLDSRLRGKDKNKAYILPVLDSKLSALSSMLLQGVNFSFCPTSMWESWIPLSALSRSMGTPVIVEILVKVSPGWTT